MPYHIPFEHRRRGCPIYIGFETIPPRPRRRWNGWGLGSLAILGLSMGALAPIAFLVGLIGMRRSPRTLAAFSTVVSGAITAVMALGLTMAVRHAHQRHARAEEIRMGRVHARQITETRALLRKAKESIDDFTLAHDGQMPDQYEGMLLTVQHSDAWKNPLRYDIDGGNCWIRSSGPDQRFDTRDDVMIDVGQAPAESVFESASFR